MNLAASRREISSVKTRVPVTCQLILEDSFKVLDFQKTDGIPMGTNGALLLADLFLHSCETDYIGDLIQKKEHRFVRSINLSFHYIDTTCILLLNNPSFGNLIHHIYPQRTCDEGYFRHCKVSLIS